MSERERGEEILEGLDFGGGGAGFLSGHDGFKSWLVGEVGKVGFPGCEGGLDWGAEEGEEGVVVCGVH